MGKQAGSCRAKGTKWLWLTPRGTAGPWPVAGCKEQSPCPLVLPKGREEEEG